MEATTVTDNTTVQPTTTTTETTQQVVVNEGTADEEEKKFEGKPRKQKKLKKGEVAEVKVESIVTADSISYSEYKEKYAQKNANLNEHKKVLVQRPTLDPTLQEMVNTGEEPVGIGKGRQPKKTTVQAKVSSQQAKTDEKEKLLNLNVGMIKS